jgi:SsrA-binding protein
MIGYSTPIMSVRRFCIAARYRQVMAAGAGGTPGRTPTINNRRARYNYLVLDSYECGIMLAGSEVKSIREGRASLQDAYARVSDGEVWLHGMHVAPYPFARAELDPVRPRKLLLHHRQIGELWRATMDRGMTLVPLRLYFKDGRVKVELAVARGKRTYDKRHAIAERDAQRDVDRALKGHRD